MGRYLTDPSIGLPQNLRGKLSEALVLVDTGPSLSPDALLFVARDASASLRSYADISEYRDQLRATYPQAPDASLDRMATNGLVQRIDGRYELKLDPGVLQDPSDGDPASMQEKLWQLLAQIGCPVLVARGGLSAMLTREAAQQMCRDALRDAELVTIENAGHAVMIDNGPDLQRAVTDFLEARL